MKIFRCHHCDAATEDGSGRHSYLFFQGVFTENVPDEKGVYRVRPISGSVNPSTHGNPPKSFCTLECFAAWVNGKMRTVGLSLPHSHPLNEV